MYTVTEVYKRTNLPGLGFDGENILRGISNWQRGRQSDNLRSQRFD